MRTTILSATLLTAAFALAGGQPYERYQSIVDRQMFGAPPAGFDSTKIPKDGGKSGSREAKELTQEQEKVKKAIRFSVINVNASGETIVGFSDNGDPKNPLHYYLKVGESQNGWTVKEADPVTATMTIEKEGVEVALTLGGDSAATPDAVKGPAASVSALSASDTAGRKSIFGRGLRERRADQEARRAAEEKARLEREERSAAVQNEMLNELQRLREERQQEREAKQQAESAAAAPKPAAVEAGESQKDSSEEN